jgi:hypothetical protein
MLEHQWKGCGWRKIKRLRNASQTVMLRIAGYQEHALRNVQPHRQRAKTDAADSNNFSVS